jgi:hypothetical protein
VESYRWGGRERCELPKHGEESEEQSWEVRAVLDLWTLEAAAAAANLGAYQSEEEEVDLREKLQTVLLKLESRNPSFERSIREQGREDRETEKMSPQKIIIKLNQKN